jgi:glutathione S-transferase
MCSLPCRARYTYADLAATPFVRRSLVALPHFRSVDPRAIAKEKGLTHLDAWFTVCCS